MSQLALAPNAEDALKAKTAKAFEDAIRRRIPRWPTPEEQAHRDAIEARNELHRKEFRAIASRAALATSLGQRYSIDRVALENYKVYDPRQGPALERIRRIGATIKEFVEEGRNLGLFGTVGTGKDHLLAYLLYQAAAAGFVCRYVNGQELFSRFRGTMGDGALETERTLLKEFSSPTVVAISDPLPPAGKLSDWNRQVLYRLLEARYRARQPTWITANITSESNADESFTEAVWDRLQDDAELFFCDWPSFREKASKEGTQRLTVCA